MHLLVLATASVSSDSALQGGIAVTVIGFAAGVVRYMVGLIEKERARGDRLEASMLDKVWPAVTQSAIALTSATDVMKVIQADAIRKGQA